LVSNNHKSTISFSLYWFIYQFVPFCYQAIFYDLVYYYIGDIKNGHGNLNFLNGFVFIIFSCLVLGKAHWILFWPPDICHKKHVEKCMKKKCKKGGGGVM
jgi:hypothetical protein